jgi:hypothetical protein
MPSPFEIGMGLLMNEKIDPNEEIPLSNRPATAFGATIPFHVRLQCPKYTEEAPTKQRTDHMLGSCYLPIAYEILGQSGCGMG